MAPRHLPGVLSFLGYDPRPATTSPGERLRLVRTKIGSSQKELARRIGVDPQTVSRFESGELLRQDVRERFAAFLEAVEAGQDPRDIELPRPRARNGYPERLETLGEHLRKRRLDLGLKGGDVAKVLECSTHTVTNVELGRTEVALRLIPKVIEFLGYNPLAVGETLVERVRWRRMSLGLSQGALARKLGLGHETIARAEKGGEPSERVRALLEIFLKEP